MPDPTTTPIAQAAQVADSTLAQLPDTIARTIARTIDVLSAKLGAPAERLAEHLAHFVVARAMGMLVAFGIALVIFGAVGTYAARRAQQAKPDSPRETAWVMVAVIGGLSTIIVLISGLVQAPSTVAQIVDPTGALVYALVSGRGF